MGNETKPGVKKARPRAKVVVRRVAKRIEWLVKARPCATTAHAFVEGHEASVCDRVYAGGYDQIPLKGVDKRCKQCVKLVALVDVVIGGKR